MFLSIDHGDDDQPSNPLAGIDLAERVQILNYLRRYHGRSDSQSPSANELLALGERVFEKIRENIDGYLEDLALGTPPEHIP